MLESRAMEMCVWLFKPRKVLCSSATMGLREQRGAMDTQKDLTLSMKL